MPWTRDLAKESSQKRYMWYAIPAKISRSMELGRWLTVSVYEVKRRWYSPFSYYNGVSVLQLKSDAILTLDHYSCYEQGTKHCARARQIKSNAGLSTHNHHKRVPMPKVSIILKFESQHSSSFCIPMLGLLLRLFHFIRIMCSHKLELEGLHFTDFSPECRFERPYVSMTIPKHTNTQVNHRGRRHNPHVLKVSIANMIVVRNTKRECILIPCVVAKPMANEPRGSNEVNPSFMLANRSLQDTLKFNARHCPVVQWPWLALSLSLYDFSTSKRKHVQARRGTSTYGRYFMNR